MATLDQIINYLADKEIVFVDGVSLGSITVSSGAATKTVDVSSHIPTGYELAAVIPRNTSSNTFAWGACALASGAAASIYVNIIRTSGSTTSITPSVMLICQKI